jgi:PmbA protein
MAIENNLLKEARYALETAQAAGAQDAMICATRSTATEFEYRDGKLEKVQQSASCGLNVTLYVDGRYSSHNSTDLRPEQVRRFIKDAVALTRHLEPDPCRKITHPKFFANRAGLDLQLVDPQVPVLTREQCLEWLKCMNTEAHGDQRVISATSGIDFKHNAEAQVTSNGFNGSREGTSIALSCHVSLDEGNGRRPEGCRRVVSRHLNALPDPRDCARTALTRALDRLGSQKGPSARATMVVDAEAGDQLLWYLSSALSAQMIQQKRSFLADKKGQKVASELLTVTDDPLMARGLGSRLYDGECISARKLPLIENGVLKNFYIDTYYGNKLGWEPTTGGMSNVMLSLGSKNQEELISDSGEGIYVNDWLGGNADNTTGDFSLGVRGHKITRGKKAGPVGEMNITGNLQELFSNLTAVGNDPTPWSVLQTPTLVFNNVNFSGM